MKIVRVGALDNNTLEIEIENGSTILLNTDLLLDRSEFAGLKEGDRILYPHTDGHCLYWHNDVQLSVDEIISLLGKA